MAQTVVDTHKALPTAGFGWLNWLSSREQELALTPWTNCGVCVATKRSTISS